MTSPSAISARIKIPSCERWKILLLSVSAMLQCPCTPGTFAWESALLNLGHEYPYTAMSAKQASGTRKLKDIFSTSPR
jgi:uncharacterized protein YhhL (DUF1145 family)